MKRTIVLFILAFIVIGTTTGCKRRKASCAAYDKVEIEERQP